MAGQYDRNRDDEGRFTGGPRRRSQWQEDDNWERENYRRGNYDRENYGRGAEPPRDDRGRFMSEGENGDYYRGPDYGERDYGNMRGARGNYGYEEADYSRGSDYDERGSRGRQYGRGSGWYGDPQGHAEAARERWQESRGPRYERDDDRGGGRERADAGRFMNSDDDRGRDSGSQGRGGGGEDHRGWFGDPRGHSQAARQGWRHRQR